MSCLICLLFWLFVIYWTVSLFFFFFPMFYKKTPNKCIQHFLTKKPFYVMGHRGGLREFPENTMAGVNYAIEKQIGMELDL